MARFKEGIDLNLQIEVAKEAIVKFSMNPTTVEYRGQVIEILSRYVVLSSMKDSDFERLMFLINHEPGTVL